ncbi:hypothetical protein ACN47E_006762 [Coniothyrium glycines]
MAPRNAVANISFTVDSASEDDMTHDELNARPTPDSNTENRAPTRKVRGHPKDAANSTVGAPRGRPAPRRVGGSSVLGSKPTATVMKKSASKGGRKALSERSNLNGSDTEDVEEFDQEEPTSQAKPARRGRPAKKAHEEDSRELPVPAPAKRGRKAALKDTVVKDVKAKANTKAKASRPVPDPTTAQATIPETQHEQHIDAMDLEQSIEIEEIPESVQPLPRQSVRNAHPQPNRARQTAAGPGRAVSASDSERDPALRRKVGDLTRKLDALTIRYDALKAAASVGKESNFEQLRKCTEQTAKDQDSVIKALTRQISDFQSRASDLTTMKRELAQLTKENSRLSSDNKKLLDSLGSSQNENKTLSSKLAAARSSVQPDVKTAPGSAVKPRAGGVVLPGTAEAAKEAHLAKQKVDFYSDLTNLVVLGVKKNEDEDEVFDCLQTGRNGTLHFHLTVVSSSEAYSDTEFVYQPLLNEQRDRELLDLLPDYLTEEICFPRNQAAKFYGRVVESMSQKIILEEE